MTTDIDRLIGILLNGCDRDFIRRIFNDSEFKSLKSQIESKNAQLRENHVKLAEKYVKLEYENAQLRPIVRALKDRKQDLEHKIETQKESCKEALTVEEMDIGSRLLSRLKAKLDVVNEILATTEDKTT